MRFLQEMIARKREAAFATAMGDDADILSVATAITDDARLGPPGGRDTVPAWTDAPDEDCAGPTGGAILEAGDGGADPAEGVAHPDILAPAADDLRDPVGGVEPLRATEQIGEEDGARVQDGPDPSEGAEADDGAEFVGRAEVGRGNAAPAEAASDAPCGQSEADHDSGAEVDVADGNDGTAGTGDDVLDAFLDAEMAAALDQPGSFEARSLADAAAQDAAPAFPPVETVTLRRKIWDLGDDTPGDDTPGGDTHGDDTPGDRPEKLAFHVATPPLEPALRDEMPGHAADAVEPRRRVGRVKTRLLGFHRADEDALPDPFADAAPETRPGLPSFPVGWMIVTAGPGRGAAFELHAGASRIGRGEDQTIRLDFGDTAISRDNHAAVAYDDESRRFFVGHGGKSNLVRLNDVPVLATEPLADGDLIRIGETTLRFIALCGPEFSWSAGQGDHRHAAAE